MCNNAGQNCPNNPGINAIGVQPPNNNPPSDLVPGGPQQPPIFIIPYPIQFQSVPSTCPCYLVEPGSNKTESSSSSPPPTNTLDNNNNYQGTNNYTNNLQQYPPNYVPPYGFIGFIPVVFFPYCPGNHTNPNMIPPIFPSAYPVPYPCSQCNQNDLNNYRNVNDNNNYSPFASNSFQQVLLQSNLPQESVIRSPSRKRIRKVKKKSD